MSHGVTVPPEHLEQGLVRQTISPTVSSSTGPSSLAASSRSSTSSNIIAPSMRTWPCDIKDYWFYIDDRDHNSKMAFNQVYHLSRLDLAVSGARLERTRPVFTLPVGR